MTATRVTAGVSTFIVALAVLSASGQTAPAVPADTNAIVRAVLAGQVRDPFVPVGYIAPETAPTDEPPVIPSLPAPVPAVVPRDRTATPAPAIAWPAVKVTGIGRAGAKGAFFAFVEGVGPVEQGHLFSKTVNGIVYTWKVERVSGEGASFARVRAAPPPRRP